MPEAFDLPEDLPATEPAPAEQTPTEPAATPEVEFVEFKNRDFEREVPKDLVQQFADALDLDVDRVRQAVQIGLDGTRLYEQVNDERDKLRQAWADLAARAQEAGGLERPRPAAPQQPQAPPGRYAPRPAAEDIYGNVAWLAEHFERVAPMLERLPQLEELVSDTRARIEFADEQRENAEEKAVAFKAYNDVATNWKKQGWGDLPTRQRLQEVLRRIPLSDDVDLTWHDIWDQVGWMVAGPDIARRQRRQAVLDIQKPGTRISTAASGAPMGAPVSRPPANGDDDSALNNEAAEIEAALKGQTLAGVYGDRRPLR